MPDGLCRGILVLEDGRIKGIQNNIPAGAEVIDAEGNYVSPGFIDMHTHGAGGADFMDCTVEAYITAARMHAMHGTTLLYPTTLTSTDELLYESFETYRKAVPQNTEGAAFGGMHLEGPYFSPAFAGAQDSRYLRNPRPEEYMQILDRCPDLARWSFAPELDGAPEFAAELRRRGIVASIGHTNATFGECDAAFRAGASLMTHFYSCMATVRRVNAYRVAGAIEAGYLLDDMYVEIIADGCHLPPELLKLIYKVKGSDRICLITDSMRAAGMPDGEYWLGQIGKGVKCIKEDGVAKLPDRSAFAGSVATTDRLVRNMVKLADVPLYEAVKMATLVPAHLLRVDDRKGVLAEGRDADILIFDDNVDISGIILRGKVIR